VRSLRGGAAVAVALMTLGVQVAGAQAPLTLAEAQRRAVARSQLLAAQDAAASAAQAMAAAAGQLPDPVRTAGVDNLPINGPDAWSFTQDFMTMRRIGLMQEWTRAEKRELRAARYEREADKAQAEKAAARATLLRDVALAWIDRYYADAAVAILDEQRTEAQLEIDAAEASYRAGRGAQADIFAARASRATLAERESDARRRAAAAITMLARWIGPGADMPLAGKPDFAAVPLSRDNLEQQLAHHPQLAVLAEEESLANAEARVARANRDPDWTFEVAYQQRGPSYSNMVSFGVSVPLPWDRPARQDKEVAAKLALADQARAVREDALRAHVAEVAVALDEWQNGRERLALYADSILPLARERTSAALAAYRGGKGTLADVLGARRNELEMQRAALDLERDIARRWAELRFLEGAHDDAPAARKEPS
jgi:outer membrane protein TolC